MNDRAPEGRHVFLLTCTESSFFPANNRSYRAQTISVIFLLLTFGSFEANPISANYSSSIQTKMTVLKSRRDTMLIEKYNFNKRPSPGGAACFSSNLYRIIILPG